MTGFTKFMPGLAALGVLACGSHSPQPAAPQTSEPIAADRTLAQLVERYWDESAALLPWYAWGSADMQWGRTAVELIEPQTMADSLAVERRYLEEVAALPRSALDPASQLTYDLFLAQRGAAIEGFTYPSELLPVDPYDGLPQRFALMATAAERLAVSSAAEYESWRIRAASFRRWTDQAILNMREGLRRGYAIPKVMVELALPALAELGADTPANVFFRSLPAAGTVADTERTRLAAELASFARASILPSFRALHDFLATDYLPRARSSVGLAALPLGDAWYLHLVKRTVGDAVKVSQLRALGIAEVDRLHQRMQSVMAEAGFSGSAQVFFEHVRSDPRQTYRTAPELLNAYQTIKDQVAAGAPSLLSTQPRADFSIREADLYRNSLLPDAFYRPRAPNGLIAAVLYVNTALLETRPAARVPAEYLGAAVPGHHYQLELQHERVDLPKFRRFGGAPAFIEGWALYATSLGDELGVYGTPEAKFESLLIELNCAAGLVVDIGVHTQGWSRGQALDYWHAQVPSDEAAAAAAVNRVIAQPAAALACGVGFFKMQALRALAEQTLGSRFDLREFHAKVLEEGAVPLDALESRVKAWISRPPYSNH